MQDVITFSYVLTECFANANGGKPLVAVAWLVGPMQQAPVMCLAL